MWSNHPVSQMVVAFIVSSDVWCPNMWVPEGSRKQQQKQHVSVDSPVSQMCACVDSPGEFPESIPEVIPEAHSPKLRPSPQSPKSCCSFEAPGPERKAPLTGRARWFRGKRRIPEDSRKESRKHELNYIYIYIYIYRERERYAHM